MLLFLVGNVLGGSVTGVYAEEMYKPASEEGVIVEQAADVPDMEAYEPEPNEDRTVKKKMCRCIVPMMSAIVLIITCAGPVRASESISEIMAEEVIAVDSDLIVESASDVEETIAEDPSLSTDAAPEGGETIAEISDTIDEKMSEAEG